MLLAAWLVWFTYIGAKYDVEVTVGPSISCVEVLVSVA